MAAPLAPIVAVALWRPARRAALVLGVALLSTHGAGAAGSVAATDAAAYDGIAWTHAATDTEVDAAFARARRDAKPVFVYWGATWCPPCNQVKATLFNRREFIERSRAFIPVYVDGDSPGAQRLGARFKVSGYPTMVLFDPQGTEITRLPGEVEPERYAQVLTLSLDAKRPAKAVLAQALADPAGLSPADWKLLAFYAWDTDEQQMSSPAGLAALLGRLATACPAAERETAMRLRLLALAAAGSSRKTANPPPPPDPRAAAALEALLAEPAAARAQLDLLSNNAAEIVRATSAPKTPPRTALRAAFDATLQRFAADASLSNADRLQALIARVDLARIDAASERAPLRLPAPLLSEIRAQSARVDREITNGYERQAAITAAAYLLDEAGLGAESDTLLRANLAKSHSPYYLMSELSANAKRRGDQAAALSWSRQAFEASQGPATRLQWGSSYLRTRIELAPAEEAAIEQLARQLLDEAARQPDAFYERSGRSLERAGAALAGWNQGGAHAAVLHRVQARLNEVCAGLPPDPVPKARCAALLQPTPKPRA